MRLNKFGKIAAAAAFAAAAWSGQAASQDKLELIFASTGPSSLPSRMAAKAALDEVYGAGGKVKVNYHTTGDLCVEHQCVEQARQRLIDQTILSCGNMGAFGLTLNFTELPYIFKDTESAKKVYDGWLTKALREQLQKVEKVQLMAIFPSGGFRGLHNNVKQVKVPADLKGIKIRVTKSPAEFSIIDSWGATAVPYDWAQMFQGLQNKVVNGMYIPHPWTWQTKLYEAITHLTQTGGLWGGNVLVMDYARYSDLPADIKAQTDKAGDLAQEKIFKADEEWVTSTAPLLTEKGITIYTPTADEMKLWRGASVEAWKKLKGTFDAKQAERALADQGMTDVLAEMKKAGVL
jgi:TRAP-type C4-dicarboxylate transport system substrate-binding protein